MVNKIKRSENYHKIKELKIKEKTKKKKKRKRELRELGEEGAPPLQQPRTIESMVIILNEILSLVY